MPDRIAITPGGTTAYVTMANPGTTVVPIDLATNTAGLPIPLGIHPWAVAIAPSGTTAYVTGSNFVDINTVTPIDLATNTPGTPIPVGPSSNGIAITPDSTKAYVTSALSNTVWPIDLATSTPGTPIPVGNVPAGIAITPAGRPDVAELLATLLNDVTGVGPGTSLADKVKQVQAYVAADDKPAACSTLNDFINLVTAQTGKKVTAAQAASFIAQATAIKSTLGC